MTTMTNNANTNARVLEIENSNWWPDMVSSDDFCLPDKPEEEERARLNENEFQIMQIMNAMYATRDTFGWSVQLWRNRPETVIGKDGGVRYGNKKYVVASFDVTQFPTVRPGMLVEAFDV